MNRPAYTVFPHPMDVIYEEEEEEVEVGEVGFTNGTPDNQPTLIIGEDNGFFISRLSLEDNAAWQAIEDEYRAAQDWRPLHANGVGHNTEDRAAVRIEAVQAIFRRACVRTGGALYRAYWHEGMYAPLVATWREAQEAYRESPLAHAC